MFDFAHQHLRLREAIVLAAAFGTSASLHTVRMVGNVAVKPEGMKVLYQAARRARVILG